LIPIKFPQYFGAGMPELLKQILGSVKTNDWVICCSENTRRDLLEYRRDLEPRRVRAIALAADARFAPCLDAAQRSAARKLLGIPQDAVYFLSLCTVEPRKNLRHLVSVFESLKSLLPANTYLVLVGNRGWQMDGLIAEVQQANDRRILMTGYVPDEWLSALYSDALAFVYPSLYEGFGLPPLEAMQCGAPVIAANNSSLPEVVGDAGILVEADAVDALSDAMVKVANSSDLRARMSAASLARAKLFSWDRCVRETVQFYRDILRDG
jgi:glycosyltransferase involved in cell wall biosynthesis